MHKLVCALSLSCALWASQALSEPPSRPVTDAEAQAVAEKIKRTKERAWSLMTSEEQRHAERISATMKREGFGKLTPLDLFIISKRWPGTYLMDEIFDAVEKSGGEQADEAQKLLGLSLEDKVRFAISTDPNMRLETMRLGKVLAARDRKLSDQELVLARRNPLLAKRLVEYIDLGVKGKDPAEIERERQQAAKELAIAKDRLPQLRADAAKAAKQLEASKARLAPLEAEMKTLAAATPKDQAWIKQRKALRDRIAAAKSELADKQSILDSLKGEIQRVELKLKN